jgi:hypothetical protein
MPNASCDQDDDAVDEYDRHREQLLNQTLHREGWRAELVRYLTDIPDNVTKDTDIIVWWGVCVYGLSPIKY